jgi:hypothetical protein
VEELAPCGERLRKLYGQVFAEIEKASEISARNGASYFEQCEFGILLFGPLLPKENQFTARDEVCGYMAVFNAVKFLGAKLAASGKRL